MKKVRTIRIDKEVSDNLDLICIRHGDVSWHIEQALGAYPPMKKLTKSVKSSNPKQPSGFTPPTMTEVYDYFLEREFGGMAARSETERFIDFYESKGWMVGKNKMKDWKAAVRNWARGKSNENNQRPNQPRRSSVVDRAHAAADERERARQARENDGPAMAEIAGDIRPSAQQPIRGDDTRELGTTLDGTYRRTD